MGFMATYWGYTSMQEVEAYMHEFRDRKLPIDSFIMDYDWFGPVEHLDISATHPYTLVYAGW